MDWTLREWLKHINNQCTVVEEVYSEITGVTLHTSRLTEEELDTVVKQNHIEGKTLIIVDA